eukprot:4490036-Pyramimonas_sp.AAC.1
MVAGLTGSFGIQGDVSGYQLSGGNPDQGTPDSGSRSGGIGMRVLEALPATRPPIRMTALGISVNDHQSE